MTFTWLDMAAREKARNRTRQPKAKTRRWPSTADGTRTPRGADSVWRTRDNTSGKQMQLRRKAFLGRGVVARSFASWRIEVIHAVSRVTDS